MVQPARHIAQLFGLLVAALCLAEMAEAQRPFAALDPFYQEETARRDFYDGFAVQADLSYRGAEPAVAATGGPTPLALAVRFDYALARQVDLSAVVDVSPGFQGGLGGSPVRLSWLVVKPYWHHGNTDYAVRIAVDPASDSGFGFRQTDIAFLSTSDLGPMVSTDFAFGLRRARVGFERIGLSRQPEMLLEEGRLPEIVRSRASGTEIHMMWGYRYWLHPGGSHFFTTLSGEAMAYALVSSEGSGGQEAGSSPSDFDPTREGRLRGGVGRLNMGIEYSRPSFMVAPYVSVPLFRWVQVDTESEAYGPRLLHSRMGLRFTVR
jgi:hypothetical protein